MADHFHEIYTHQAALYDRMVSREDHRGNLFAVLNEIASLAGVTAVDLGAGTGRMTRLLALLAGHVHAFDAALPMLSIAAVSLEQSGMTNWSLGVADNRAIPLPGHSADLALQGWSFGHAVGWYPERWREEIGRMLTEMQRVVKPGGTLVLLETLGTGTRQPQPPTEGLAALYRWWETEHGFQHRWIRTDYQFASVAEAEELTRFFFGDELADRIVREEIVILPECTGIWWKQV